MASETTFIYSLSDPQTLQVRYIGKADSLSIRLRTHLKPSKAKTHKTCWLQSLKAKGVAPLIELVDEVPVADWQFWEQYYISLFSSWGFNLTNSTFGGDGVLPTASLRKKFSENMLSQWADAEEKKEYYRSLRKGKTYEEIYGPERASEMKAKVGARVGTACPPERAEKIKQTLLAKNQKQSDATKAKISAAKTGKACLKRRVHHPVVQKTLDGKLIKRWDSHREAAESFGSHPNNLLRNCNGLTKHFKGFVWTYP